MSLDNCSICGKPNLGTPAERCNGHDVNSDNNMTRKEFLRFRAEIRKAVANYIRSEGCECCRSSDHDKHEARVGELLKVRKYADGSGYDFHHYSTERN